jgi:UrcA family protein
MRVSKSPLRLALLASAIGFALTGAASAQEYVYHDGAPPEEVTIYAPHYRAPERSTIGAPIENVAISETVRFNDLDLNSAWGINRLDERIRAKAESLCHRIDIGRVPVDDPQDCYRDAVADAHAQVDAIIQQARYDAPEPRYRRYDSTSYYNPPPPNTYDYNNPPPAYRDNGDDYDDGR